MKSSWIPAAALALGCAAALAHDDASLDKVKAPNGGQLRMAGLYHYELVVAKDSKEARENPIMVYVTDHAEKKIPTAGVKGSANLIAGQVRASITLAPDGDNRMKGFGKYASDPGMKVVVSLTFADGRTEQARFEPLKAAGEAHAGHEKH